MKKSPCEEGLPEPDRTEALLKSTHGGCGRLVWTKRHGEEKRLKEVAEAELQ